MLSALLELQETVTQPVVLVATALGFLAGSIPFGLLLARAFAKTDVRGLGSGNIGATNVARVAGKKLGVITLILDVIKGAVPVIAVRTVLMNADAEALTVDVAESVVGLAAFLGHCYPPWLRFRGGKGVATGLGVLLAHAPEVAFVGVLVFAVVFAASRTVSLGSMVAALALVGGFFAFRDVDATLIPLALMLFTLLFKHRSNMARLWRRQEMRL